MKLIDEHGSELPDIHATIPLSKENMELEGVSYANALVCSGINFIGGIDYGDV